MAARSSTAGRAKAYSRLAMNFTHSLDPAVANSSTFRPAFSNQPNFMAIAYGAAAEVTTFVHHPTRTGVSAVALAALPKTAIATANAPSIGPLKQLYRIRSSRRLVNSLHTTLKTCGQPRRERQGCV